MSKKRKHSQPIADYRSGYERKLRVFLLQNKIPFLYESAKYKLTLPVVNHTCSKCGSQHVVRRVTYTPDWLLTGRNVVVESKGKFTARDRKIALAMQAQHPDVLYCLLFQRDNWISKTKTQRYSDWCKKHYFAFHIGTEFPKEWWA